MTIWFWYPFWNHLDPPAPKKDLDICTCEVERPKRLELLTFFFFLKKKKNAISKRAKVDEGLRPSILSVHLRLRNEQTPPAPVRPLTLRRTDAGGRLGFLISILNYFCCFFELLAHISQIYTLLLLLLLHRLLLHHLRLHLHLILIFLSPTGINHRV